MGNLQTLNKLACAIKAAGLEYTREVKYSPVYGKAVQSCIFQRTIRSGGAHGERFDIESDLEVLTRWKFLTEDQHQECLAILKGKRL